MEAPAVVLYTRAGCHLCDVVKASLQRLASQARFSLTVIDIDSDPALRAQYNEEVPVILINGRKAFKYQMDEADFLRRLSAL